MKEYYEILGLSADASDAVIAERYEALKAKYKEDRWLSGEAGNEAARNLTKLEAEYAEILAARKERNKHTEGKSAFEEVRDFLKEDKIAEAQARLDEFNERNAEWHYLQAVVYYKKNWTNDSKKQLEIAMEMDPNTEKYRVAYGKLNKKDEYEQQEAHKKEEQAQNPYSNRHFDDEDAQMGGNDCSNCISCCYTYLCVDCLFSLCCGCR